MKPELTNLVLSRYMVQKTDPGPGQTHDNFSSWARYVPNFFLSDTLSSQPRTNHRITLSRSRHDDAANDEAALKADAIEGLSTCNTPDLQVKRCGSESSGYEDAGEDGERDLERGEGRGGKVQSEVRVGDVEDEERQR